eukprot:jgi/Tetstr1/459124/TSEL_004572.t1
MLAFLRSCEHGQGIVQHAVLLGEQRVTLGSVALQRVDLPSDLAVASPLQFCASRQELLLDVPPRALVLGRCAFGSEQVTLQLRQHLVARGVPAGSNRAPGPTGSTGEAPVGVPLYQN